MTQTFDAEKVKEMLKTSMETFSNQMIALIRECADHRQYRDLSGKEALLLVADRMDDLRRKNA